MKKTLLGMSVGLGILFSVVVIQISGTASDEDGKTFVNPTEKTYFASDEDGKTFVNPAEKTYFASDEDGKTSPPIIPGV